MNHEEQVILYAAGQLSQSERLEFEKHLVSCADCQADLQIWNWTAKEISITSSAASAPVDLAERALDQVNHAGGLWRGVQQAWQLLYVQSQVIQREMWPASAALMALGAIVAVVSEHAEFVYFLAPLVAAASLALLFSPEYDPALELTLSTPTSPWKVLLARLSLVSAYNLVLALAAALVLLVIVPPGLLGALILGWLGPMTFLSALALLLSLWLGTGNAIAIAYGLWLLQYIPYQSLGAWMDSPGWSSIIPAYQQFWQSPSLLLWLSIFLFGAALWLANRMTFHPTPEVG